MVPWEDAVEEPSSTQTLQRGQEKRVRVHSYVHQQANETNQSVEIIYSRLSDALPKLLREVATGYG